MTTNTLPITITITATVRDKDGNITSTGTLHEQTIEDAVVLQEDNK